MVGDTDVFEALAGADTVYMSVFVQGELFAGFRGGGREEENRNILKKFLEKPSVKIMMASPETADIFGWFKRNGDRSMARENLGMAVEILKECGADGWVEKYEK
jgi:hypothetical protein